MSLNNIWFLIGSMQPRHWWAYEQASLYAQIPTGIKLWHYVIDSGGIGNVEPQLYLAILSLSTLTSDTAADIPCATPCSILSVSDWCCSLLAVTQIVYGTVCLAASSTALFSRCSPTTTCTLVSMPKSNNLFSIELQYDLQRKRCKTCRGLRFWLYTESLSGNFLRLDSYNIWTISTVCRSYALLSSKNISGITPKYKTASLLQSIHRGSFPLSVFQHRYGLIINQESSVPIQFCWPSKKKVSVSITGKLSFCSPHAQSKTYPEYGRNVLMK
mgnify:CR=1 FL=1